MKKRGRFLYEDAEGTIFMKFEHPGKGVPIESLLPQNGRGAGFADFRITDYFNLANLVLAAPQDWKTFSQTTNVQGATKANPAKVVPSPPNLDFLNLRNAEGDLDADQAAELFTIVAAFWSAPKNELALEPGLVAALWRSGVKAEAIVQYIRDFTDANGKLAIPGGRGIDILNTAIETFRSVKGLGRDEVLPQSLVTDAIMSWISATRSVAAPSPESSNTVLHWADYKRLGLVDANGAVVLDNVRRLARVVFSTDRKPSFDELVCLADQQKISPAKQDSASNKALKAMLKKKRAQGKLNRKRGRR